MKKTIALLCATTLLAGVSLSPAMAERSKRTETERRESSRSETRCYDGRDNDRDGLIDCRDSDCATDPACWVAAQEVCNDGIDNDGNGLTDCNDSNCAGDPSCLSSSGPHADLLYEDYPANCLNCHAEEFGQMLGSTHYRWLGEAPDMLNGVGQLQGKLTNAVNSYCINIAGDWPVCGKCHAGRGLRPDDPAADATNIDCLVCHNTEYALQRTRLEDGSMGVVTPSDSMVREIQAPTRENCLKCHAYAGGNNAVKRGDLSWETASNTDSHFDVHMNGSGANLQCQSCHVFADHKTIGKGSDLRPTDDLVRGSEVGCTTCHAGKDTLTGHGSANTDIGRHSARVACQTCHIPTYAKVATETHRDWTLHHDGTPADGVSGPGHPASETASNLVPEYLWWNRMSENTLLHDDATLTYDAELDTYPTSRPLGGFMDGKIYPFKYKTAYQPMTSADNRLIALDTLEYLSISGDVEQAIANGLVNMGYQADTAYEWVTTDTYQLINHGIEPRDSALDCQACHGSSGITTDSRMPFAALGYHTWPALVKNCTLCHEPKSMGWQSMHSKHEDKLGANACTSCHTTEPTGLIEPATSSGLCNNCHSAESYEDLQSLHKKHVEAEDGEDGLACTACHTF